MKWLAALILISIIASGCTISMQPAQSPRYFNYIEPSPYQWYYNPYYYSPSIHIHPKPHPRPLHPRHNGPRR